MGKTLQVRSVRNHKDEKKRGVLRGGAGLVILVVRVFTYQEKGQVRRGKIRSR